MAARSRPNLSAIAVALWLCLTAPSLQAQAQPTVKKSCSYFSQFKPSGDPAIDTFLKGIHDLLVNELKSISYVETQNPEEALFELNWGALIYKRGFFNTGARYLDPAFASPEKDAGVGNVWLDIRMDSCEIDTIGTNGIDFPAALHKLSQKIPSHVLSPAAAKLHYEEAFKRLADEFFFTIPVCGSLESRARHKVQELADFPQSKAKRRPTCQRTP